jgi:hypothetical protein
VFSCFYSLLDTMELATIMPVIPLVANDRPNITAAIRADEEPKSSPILRNARLRTCLVVNYKLGCRRTASPPCFEREASSHGALLLDHNVEWGRSQFLVLMSKYRPLSKYRHEIFVTKAGPVKFLVILN